MGSLVADLLFGSRPAAMGSIWTVQFQTVDIVAVLMSIVVAQIAVIIVLLVQARRVQQKSKRDEQLLDTIIEEQQRQVAAPEVAPPEGHPPGVSRVYMAQNLKSEVFHTCLKCTYLEKSTARTIHKCPRCE